MLHGEELKGKRILICPISSSMTSNAHLDLTDRVSTISCRFFVSFLALFVPFIWNLNCYWAVERNSSGVKFLNTIHLEIS